MIIIKDSFINDQWLAGEGTQRQVINPAKGEVITTVKEASRDQTIHAISAARKAFDQSDWATNLEKRAGALTHLAQLLEESKNELAKIESENTGKPLREAEIDVEDGVNCIRYYANLIRETKPKKIEMSDGTVSEVIQEPIGVCGLIVPWNFPLLLGLWKLAPALAAGNTVVFKPSEVTPLSFLKFTQLIAETDIPKGVFNLILGDGALGKIIVESEDVDKISFTGSSDTGRKINEQCASSFKRVSLELGGKSPLIILADADLEKAVEWAVFGAFFNQGEVCVASSRILVDEKIYEDFLQKFVEYTSNIRIGDPEQEQTELGSLVSAQHLEKVQHYISTGLEEGATIAYGGKRIERPGYFIEPTIFTNVDQQMKIVQEEIFGPVVTVQTFKSEEEAIQLANGTKFGLAGGILTADAQKARLVASKIKAGTIWINSYHTPYIEAPWGGFKQSGIGRELGPQGLASFTETKHVNTSEEIGQLGWYSFKNN
ncbi:aldehyde dehydrogenase family protein [Metabacillus litoralis]|uniref:aldehyde dehydrogenase family protein n=1 Tax=Metabacillus litoralis TaxID=152268 RepID=UPI0037CC777A